MDVEFDPSKDAENLRKHGFSLAQADDFEFRARFPDERFLGEPRFRAYGYLQGKPCCLAYAIRDGRLRAISLRRAHAKEMKRHGL